MSSEIKGLLVQSRLAEPFSNGRNAYLLPAARLSGLRGVQGNGQTELWWRGVVGLRSFDAGTVSHI